MNITIDAEFNKELKVNDILVYTGAVWTNLSKEEYLAVLNHELRELENRLNKLEALNEELSKKVAELRGEE